MYIQKKKGAMMMNAKKNVYQVEYIKEGQTVIKFCSVLAQNGFDAVETLIRNGVISVPTRTTHGDYVVSVDLTMSDVYC